MMTLRYMFVMAAMVVLASCGKQEPRGKQGGGSVAVKEPKLERDVPEMGATYNEAFEEARKEITKDNAEDMLDAIEHDVNKGQ